MLLFFVQAKILRRWLCINKTTLKSPCTPEVFRRHYRIRLNTYGVFSDYDKALLAYSQNTHKESRIRRNKFALLIIHGDFKGTVYQKKRLNWTFYTGPERTIYKFYFSVILKKNCSLRMGNTLNGEISVKIKHILVNNRTQWEKFGFSLPTLDRFE